MLYLVVNSELFGAHSLSKPNEISIVFLFLFFSERAIKLNGQVFIIVEINI